MLAADMPQTIDINAAMASLQLKDAMNSGMCAPLSRPRPLGLRLHDSMELYRRQGTLNRSPPQNHMHSRRRDRRGAQQEVQEEEDDIIFVDDEEHEGDEGITFEEEEGEDGEDGEEEEERSDGSDDGKEDKDEDEEDDEEDEDEDDEEGETDFSESEEEEDSEVLEDDELEDEAPSPTIVEIPFWFGHEDKDHIKFIIEAYMNRLNLQAERKKMIRAPEPFVGRVKRVIVRNEGVFTTFDTVEVYTRSTLPPGSTMPLDRTSFFLTSWSMEDGLPTRFFPLSEKMQKFWTNLIDTSHQPSYLFCMPDYGSTFKDYDYMVSSSENPVTHSPRSIPIEEQQYRKCIHELHRSQPDHTIFIKPITEMKEEGWFS